MKTTETNPEHRPFAASRGASRDRLVSSSRNKRQSLLAALALTLAFAGPAVAKPKIVGVTTDGPYVTFVHQVGPQRYDAALGNWSGGFGTEPYANSQLIVDLKVNGLGGVELGYMIQTVDVAFFDWLDIYLVTSTGVVPLVTGYNPNPSYGPVFIGPEEYLSTDLSPWKGETVQLVISAHQDGFSDQFQALIGDLTTFGYDD